MNCYVYNHRTMDALPDGLDKDNTMFYPEKRMTTHDLFHTMRPKDFHVVTDSPYIVPLYDRKEVFILEDGKWVHPDFQTFGCSYEIVTDRIWNYRNSIPQAIINSDKCTNCMGHRRETKG